MPFIIWHFWYKFLIFATTRKKDMTFNHTHHHFQIGSQAK